MTAIGNDRVIKVLHKMLWKELLLLIISFTIGFKAQQQVVSESSPRVSLIHRMNHLAIGCIFMIVGKTNLSIQITDQNIAGTCSTVVVKVIITVSAVLGLVIFLQCHNDSATFCRIQVELLFFYPPSFFPILFHENIKWHDAHLIISQSEDEAKYKILLLE